MSFGRRKELAALLECRCTASRFKESIPLVGSIAGAE
jgi:hypothetical protein